MRRDLVSSSAGGSGQRAERCVDRFTLCQEVVEEIGCVVTVQDQIAAVLATAPTAALGVVCASDCREVRARTPHEGFGGVAHTFS